MKHHSAHILRTIASLMARSVTFGLSPQEDTLMRLCYEALEDDHAKKEAQQIAMLQIEKKQPRNYLDYTSMNCIPLNEPDHIHFLCPVSILFETSRIGRPLAVTSFSRN